jgi:hypothetical protein
MREKHDRPTLVGETVAILRFSERYSNSKNCSGSWGTPPPTRLQHDRRLNHGDHRQPDSQERAALAAQPRDRHTLFKVVLPAPVSMLRIAGAHRPTISDSNAGPLD